jgi:hypothetical protein
MIKHVFEDMKPHLDAENELTGIEFTLVSTEGNFVNKLKWHTPAQLVGVAYPKQADLLAKCQEIAELLGLYGSQEKKLRDAQMVENPALPVQAEVDEAAQRRTWVTAVDDTIAAIISKQTRFQMGYVEREAAALAYKNSGFTGDPTVWVTRFADNVKMPYKDAALLILSQATNLRTALKELEGLRMDKYLITAASTQELAEAQFNRIIRAAQTIASKL